MFERAVALVDDTPALVVDWAVVEGNVERMAALGRERMVSMRPHIKTHKLASLAQLQMSAGAVGVTVAKLGEARVMIEAGIHDVLVAYPIVGASRVRELVDLSSQSDITVALDSWEAAEPIAVEASSPLRRRWSAGRGGHRAAPMWRQSGCPCGRAGRPHRQYTRPGVPGSHDP